jgi:hypothetical protein
MRSRLLVASVVAAGALAAPAAGSNVSPRWFVIPGRSVSCELGLDRHGSSPVDYVFCLAYRLGSPYRTAVAVRLSGSAGLTVCHGLPCIGNTPRHVPTLPVGHSIRLGPFRCTSRRRGVRCTVTRLGRGFELSAAGLRRVRS